MRGMDLCVQYHFCYVVALAQGVENRDWVYGRRDVGNDFAMIENSRGIRLAYNAKAEDGGRANRETSNAQRFSR